MNPRDQISDTVLYSKQFDGQNRCTSWVQKCCGAYDRLRPMRMARKECKEYELGRQYEKTMIWNGKPIKKREYMEKMGLPVIQFNTLGKNKRVILGQYRQNDVAPICTATDPGENKYADFWSELLRKNQKKNQRSEKDAKNFDEFLRSGLPVYKVSYGRKNGKTDVWVDRVNPDLMFFPFTEDDDLKDVNFIGQLHSWTFQRILATFAHSRADEKRLREIYAHCNEDDYIVTALSTDGRTYDIANTDFHTPFEYNKHRVIECWSLECRPAYLVHDEQEPEDYYVPQNQRELSILKAKKAARKDLNIMKSFDGVTPMTDDEGNVMTFESEEKFWSENDITWKEAYEEYWYYRYMTPDGYILEEGVTPYWDGTESMHPYVVKGYPMVDGEVRGHVQEMIPAQDYLNYYIVSLDFYLKNAAKGVMMVDEASISDMQSFEEMCDEFIKTNGVVLYTSKNGGKAPDVKTAGSIPGGFDYMINLANSMGESNSGATASLAGQKESSSMSGVMYSQMVNQAATSLSDMFGTYNDFLEQTAYKVVKIMKCCYTGMKKVSIYGEVVEEDMSTLCDVDTDITISQNANTPTYKALQADRILDMGYKGLIPIEVAIEASGMPDADRIKTMIEKAKQVAMQQAAQQQAAQQASVPAAQA